MTPSEYFDWHDKLFMRLLMACRRDTSYPAVMIGVWWGQWMVHQRMKKLGY
jgi:hypothetical protein